MKQWAKKLIESLDIDWSKKKKTPGDTLNLSEDRATLLFILDVYNKHLIDFNGHPVRKIRETLDDFAKTLVDAEGESLEKTLYRLRHFFSTYRIDEYTYIQKTFEDFKAIIWDFADQLSEDVNYERKGETEVKSSLNQLKEAVESNSIEVLRSKSREFIDFYVEYQTKKDERRTQRISSMQKNLSVAKKRLLEANATMRTDHLTNAFNRMSFDEEIKEQHKNYQLSKTPVSLISLDIDHFKKINDSYGHDIGDFVLKECVSMLKEVFKRDLDMVARVGGEEFAIVLPDFRLGEAIKKAEEALNRIRKEVILAGEFKLQFTISLGVSQLLENESIEEWVKRTDEALYKSKHTGRNRLTVANKHPQVESVA